MREKLISILAGGLAVTCGFSQITVHIAFNIANCEAHSRQISTLAELDPDVPKYLIINRLDSILTPWIIDRFGLQEIPSLHYRYLQGNQLTRYYDVGRSLVFIISGADTISRFPIELLPSQIDRISELVKTANSNTPAIDDGNMKLIQSFSPTKDSLGKCRDAQHSGLRYGTVKLLPQGDLPPIGSGAQVISGHDQIWLLDHFFGNIYRMDLSGPHEAILELVDNVPSLLLAAEVHQYGSSRYGRMAIQTDGIVSIDPTTDLPVIHLVCTDTTKNSSGTKVPEYHRVLLALHESGPPSIIAVDYSARADELFPSLSPTGYVWQDELIIAPVHHFSASRDTYPLFGYFQLARDSLKLLKAVPYDYRKPQWTEHAAYNYVNGRFCDGYFSFAIAPLIVNTRTWEETDISHSIGISMDSIFAAIPMKYYMIDMKCANGKIAMLCWVSGGFVLITFQAEDRMMRLESYAGIETGAFRSRGATLLDNGDVVFISESLDELMVISTQP